MTAFPGMHRVRRLVTCGHAASGAVHVQVTNLHLRSRRLVTCGHAGRGLCGVQVGNLHLRGRRWWFAS